MVSSTLLATYSEQGVILTGSSLHLKSIQASSCFQTAVGIADLRATPEERASSASLLPVSIVCAFILETRIVNVPNGTGSALLSVRIAQTLLRDLFSYEKYLANLIAESNNKLKILNTIQWFQFICGFSVYRCCNKNSKSVRKLLSNLLLRNTKWKKQPVNSQHYQ